jgi:hypothetical protein
MIFHVRGEKIILDADLASLYGVTTKRLNEQVKRNENRFPADFCFRFDFRRTRNYPVAKCDSISAPRSQSSDEQQLTITSQGQ